MGAGGGRAEGRSGREEERGAGSPTESGAPALRTPPPPGLDARWHFTVGPTQLHPLVPEATARAFSAGLPSWSHRSGPARAEVARTVEALRTLLAIPDDHRVLFMGSATEAMERIMEGAVLRDSFHLVNGAFGRRFRTVSERLGHRADGVEVADGEGFDLDRIEVPEEAELIALTQNETSTGVALDPEGIARLADRNPGRLIAVDTVSAAPTAPLDLRRVDAAFFSVQKLFGLPAGLGVLVASPRLIERSMEKESAGRSVGGVLGLGALWKAAGAHETVATPNSLAIHLLGRVAESYLAQGLERLRTESREGFERLSAAAIAAGWTPFASRPQDRSGTVLVHRTPHPSGTVRATLAERGFLIGGGYGPHAETTVRIALFPVQPPAAVAELAETIAGLAEISAGE